MSFARHALIEARWNRSRLQRTVRLSKGVYFMSIRSVMLVGALMAASLAPGPASTASILDTGVPMGSGAPEILSTAQWLAGEFAVSSGEINQAYSLFAYLTQGAGQINDTFTFDVYSSSGFTNRPSNRPAPIFTATGTFTGNGWNSSGTQWIPTATGDYWLALQVTSSAQTNGLDAPVEALQKTGTVPALAFAYAPSSGQYTTSGAAPIGLEITATNSPGDSAGDGPLPLWASGALGAGLIGIASRRLKKVA
jgi:hypothetical protein